MSSHKSVDPYLYPGTDVLINKFDIEDFSVLQELEGSIFAEKSLEPLPIGNLDYNHFKAIHYHFFSEIYTWAGQERTVDITKGHSHFARKEFIAKELQKIFIQLKDEQYLQGSPPSEFCQKLSYYFNEMNAAHPFRDGNGRTQRAFCDALAKQVGYAIDWSRISRERYLEASIEGFQGKYLAMEKIFNGIVIMQEKPRLAAQSITKSDQYKVSETVTAAIFQKNIKKSLAKRRLLVMNGQKFVQNHQGKDWFTDKMEKAGTLRPGIYNIYLSIQADKTKRYDGIILHVDKDYVYQKTDKNFVSHDRGNFDNNKLPEVGSVKSISYDEQGCAKIEATTLKLGKCRSC